MQKYIVYTIREIIMGCNNLILQCLSIFLNMVTENCINELIMPDMEVMSYLPEACQQPAIKEEQVRTEKNH